MPFPVESDDVPGHLVPLVWDHVRGPEPRRGASCGALSCSELLSLGVSGCSYLGDGEVALEAVASDDEVAEVAAAFTDSGYPGGGRAWVEGRGAGAFQWILMISVPATAFLTALAAEAGKDAYKVLKRLVGRIHEARTAAGTAAGWTTDSVAVVDEETSTWILVPPELPEEAWRALSRSA